MALTLQRVADFETQVLLWGYDDAGEHNWLDEAWEDRTLGDTSMLGHPLWDRDRRWLETCLINDEPAPERCALPGVVELMIKHPVPAAFFC